MPDTESSLPEDWFVLANIDMEAAAILLEENGPLAIVAFHLQQATEKSLKGYLLGTGWKLRRLHDLEVLVNDAIARHTDFVPFLEPCQRITEYYIESRYPTGLQSPFDADDLQADLLVVQALMALIRHHLSIGQ